MEGRKGYTRREWLAVLGGGAAAFVHSCRAKKPAHVRLDGVERKLMVAGSRFLPVVQWNLKAPDPTSVLRRKALPARGLPAGFVRKLDRLMRETLRRSHGVGLAAPQVGISRRVVLVQLQDASKEVLTCVDPGIVNGSTETVPGYEACLSIRGVGGKVNRKRWVQVSYFDLDGRLRVRRSEGWEARIFQHELDHLDGVLYVDKLEGNLLPIDEVRRIRKLEAKRKRGGASVWESEEALRPYLAERDTGTRLWML